MTESDRGSAASDSTSIFAGGLFGSPEAETSEDVVGLEGLSAGSALLVVKRGPNAGSRFQLDRDKITAGRHPESDIFLDDVTVSRRHAEFRRTAEGFEVADIGSPERDLRQPGTDRGLHAVQWRRGADREVPAGLPVRRPGRG